MTSSFVPERAFNYLWAAVTVSLFGTLITRVAIPYLAILTLAAHDSAVVWLNMAEVFAGILGAVFLGTWVDRASRKRLINRRGLTTRSSATRNSLGMVERPFKYGTPGSSCFHRRYECASI